MDQIMFLILAGGRGERLRPLTNRVPKPLVRFKSSGAIIDCTLYNCLAHNEGDVQVLTQYRGSKIRSYIDNYWKSAFRSQGRKISCLHGKRNTAQGYRGTADAVYKALRERKDLPQYVMVLASDHIYQMEYGRIIHFHKEHGGTATVGCVECSHEDSHRFGIIKAEMNGRIERFHEKPLSLAGIVPPRQRPFASMGIYVFSTRTLLEYLQRNQNDESHDFGKDILPEMALNQEAWRFHFMQADGSCAYWRDVGDLSAYLEANLEQISGSDDVTRFNFIPGIQDIPTYKNHRVVCHTYGKRKIINSKIADTARVDEATIENSVVCPHARIESGAIVKNSIILDGAVIQRFAEVIDAVVVPNGQVSGEKNNPSIFHPRVSSSPQNRQYIIN